MNKEANRKTIAHHSTDSNSRRTTLPKNRSCPNICAGMNPYTHPKENRRLIPANTYYFNKDLKMKGKSDFQSSSKLSEEEEGDYETVSSSTLEAIHALRILPAKPPQESEYADKRCLKPPGATSPPSTHQSPRCSAKQTSVLEERSMAGVRGERTKINGAQDPVPPPRPLKTLPKQYQPLPPEPKTSSQLFHTRKMLSQAQAFPASAKATSHLSVKEVNEAPGREKATGLGETPGMAFQAQQYKPNHHPEASFQSTGSSISICSSGSMLNVENLSVKRSPSPMPSTACKSKLKHSLVKKESQPLAQPIEKDLNKYEWYIGEYDRQEAEEALLEESTDETFLVRNCSKKSNTEPYVLVVYYGRRVYNIKVRFLEESQQYALGTGLRGDDKFNSVKEIIEFYKYVPITLIDGKDKSGIQREQCFLTHPLKSHKRCFLP